MGGAQKIVLSLFNKIDRKNFNVYLIAGKGAYLDNEALNIKDGTVQLWEEIKHPISPTNDIRAIIKMAKYFREKKIDIVNTHCSKAGVIGRLAAKLNGINDVFHTVHLFPFHAFQNAFVHNLYVFIERVVTHYTKKIIAVGQDIKQYGIRSSVGKESQYTIIQASVDTERFVKKRNVRDQFLESLGLLPDNFTVGMVGNMKKQKNPEEFIEIACLSCAEDKNIQFILAGGGNVKKERKLKRKINSAGFEERIKLLGWIDNPEELFSSIDVFVLTSLWEGLPCTLLQSYCAGIPFVATDINGNSEVKKLTGVGSLYNNGDIVSAKNAIFRMRGKKFSPSKSIVSEFDESLMIKNYESLFGGGY
jgi:glycosyltransferase involved in cell wall biosynthesis